MKPPLPVMTPTTSFTSLFFIFLFLFLAVLGFELLALCLLRLVLYHLSHASDPFLEPWFLI
jgi:hypothetical protein